MSKFPFLLHATFIVLWAGVVSAANIVPPEIEQPGTQPGEVGTLESPNKCDNCHGGYNSAVEPAHNWRGSMMAHAGRDPIFWATLAIAEQDFDGSGDLCLRCHSTGGWLAGRSTPTDGSGLASGDSDGVECDFCHKMTNPDDSEHPGVMSPGFIANEPDGADPDGLEGYLGSGMASLWGGSDKLGPYIDAEARHQFMQSNFHRDRDFCGTCHDVSNPAVGHLAHNHGAQATGDAVALGGNPGNSGDPRVAFSNPPYRYGVVERTFSEYKSGQISQTRVSDYPSLPDDLRGGALEAAYNAATLDGTTDGDYQNPSMPRFFSCQTCHLRAVTGTGANKRGVPVRQDLPLHDMTGGNYWMPEAIEYLDAQGKLRLGGGLDGDELAALRDGALRAREQLDLAASLLLSGNTVKVVNHTGHKLISGYPEGRRMWLRVQWYDAAGALVGLDGEYGNLEVDLDGDQVPETTVRTLLDLTGADTRIYEAHYGMTQEWAAQLNPDCATNPSSLPLSYDRITGDPDFTLGDLACSPQGSTHETFHFVLNNVVIKDNRIPPYGMRYDAARERNALPVPQDQFGGNGPGSTYRYWDEVTLNPPVAATSATIELLYQPTSWEYVQFLLLANDGQNGFLADEGANLFEAWMNTGMAEPHVIASTDWGAPPISCTAEVPALESVIPEDKAVRVDWLAVLSDPLLAGFRLYYDQAGKAQEVAELPCIADDQSACVGYLDTGLTNGQEYCYKVTSYQSASCESAFSPILCATPVQPGQQTTVPDVVGLPQADAEASLTAADLLVGTVDLTSSETVPAGQVISQDPDAGTLVPADSTVDLSVSTGPASAPAMVVASLTSNLKRGKDYVPSNRFGPGDTVWFLATVNDLAGDVALSGAAVNLEVRDAGGAVIEALSVSSDDTGVAAASWKIPRRGLPAGVYSGHVVGLTLNGYVYDSASSIESVAFDVN